MPNTVQWPYAVRFDFQTYAYIFGMTCTSLNSWHCNDYLTDLAGIHRDNLGAAEPGLSRLEIPINTLTCKKVHNAYMDIL